MSELVSPASIASWPEPGAELPASSPLGETFCQCRARFNSKDPEPSSQAPLDFAVRWSPHSLSQRDYHTGLHKLHSAVAELELQTQTNIKMSILRSKNCFSSNNRPSSPIIHTSYKHHGCSFSIPNINVAHENIPISISHPTRALRQRQDCGSNRRGHWNWCRDRSLLRPLYI
jgi:hypothetical protein